MAESYKMPQEEADIILDSMRETGNTNMASSYEYLVDYYSVPRMHAKQLMFNWIKSYNDRRQNGEIN